MLEFRKQLLATNLVPTGTSTHATMQTIVMNKQQDYCHTIAMDDKMHMLKSKDILNNNSIIL